MDREELIARLREAALDIDRKREAGFAVIPLRAHLGYIVEHNLDVILAALESRPAPTEERILVAAKAAWRADMIDAADQRGHPMHDGFDFEWGWKELATMPLSGPGFVRQWTTIAKAALATDTTPSRDEEGSVDREALQIAAQCVQWDLEAVEDGGDPAMLLTMLKGSSRRLLDALKASTPETQTVEGGERDGPVAVLRFAKGRPGNENEMPKVISCNWLPDGEYSVFLAKPTTPERAMVLEEAARVADSFAQTARVNMRPAGHPLSGGIVDGILQNNAGIAERIAEQIRALSASPIEVEK